MTGRPHPSMESVFIVFYVTGKKGQKHQVSSVHATRESAEAMRRPGELVGEYALWKISDGEGRR